MTRTEQMVQLMEGPPGRVLAIPGRPGCYWVRGSEQVYEVVLAMPDTEKLDECECVGFQHRGRCKHLAAATAQWQRDRPPAREYTQDELRRMFA